MIKLNFHRIR